MNLFLFPWRPLATFYKNSYYLWRGTCLEATCIKTHGVSIDLTPNIPTKPGRSHPPLHVATHPAVPELWLQFPHGPPCWMMVTGEWIDIVKFTKIRPIHIYIYSCRGLMILFWEVWILMFILAWFVKVAWTGKNMRTWSWSTYRWG